MNQQSKWQEWMERIQSEVQEALEYREVYWDLKHIREKHSVTEVRRNNIIYDMLAWGYVYKVFFAIRKQTSESNTEITLLRILKEMHDAKPTIELEEDIKFLRSDPILKTCRQYVNKNLAHASEKLPRDTTFQNGTDTINKIWQLVQKYYEQINSIPLERTSLGYNWKEILKYSWIET